MIIKKIMYFKIFFGILLCYNMAFASSFEANDDNVSYDTPVPTSIKSSSDQKTTSTVMRQKATEELDKLLTSEIYSKQKTVQIPQVKPKKSEDLSWLARALERLARFGYQISGTVGVLGKTVAIILLCLMGFMLYRKRHIWLKIFGKINFTTLDQSSTATTVKHNHPQELWQSLPPKEEFLSVLQKLLKNHQWLLVLSLLYQGTLREMARIHDLPIDKHQTEDECMWLLAHAQTLNRHEQQYFQDLVALWRESAYGKKTPNSIIQGNYDVIYQLMSAWQMIYEKRG